MNHAVPKSGAGATPGSAHSNTAGGARTFLSAASTNRSTSPILSRALSHLDAAADKNVRAPALASMPRCTFPGPRMLTLLGLIWAIAANGQVSSVKRDQEIV